MQKKIKESPKDGSLKKLSSVFGLKKNIIIVSDSQEIFLQTVQSIEKSPSKSFEGMIFHTHLIPEIGIKIIERLVLANEEVYAVITNFRYKTSIETNYETGLDTIREVKRRFPRIRTILISEQGEEFNKINESVEKNQIDGWIEQKTGNIGDKIVSLLEECIEDYENLFLRGTDSLLGKNILITGVTGFLGECFFKSLFKSTDANFYILGRPKKEKSLAERVGLIDDRVHYIEGDLTQPKVVANKKELDLLIDVIEEVWHFVAITDFDETRRNDTILVNLVGTVNLITILKDFKRLRCFNHISTAYVVGEMYDPDVAMEIMPSPWKFRNPYEESKFYGECVVRDSGIPFRIFRPSMIVGDSITGKSDGKTMYGAALMLFIAKQRYGPKQIFKILGEKKANKNLIPINAVVDLLIGIRNSNKGLYETFALVNPESTNVGEIIDTVAECLQIDVKYDSSLDESKIKSECDGFLYRSLEVMRKYMTISDPKFSLANTMELMPNYKIPKPTKELLHFLIGTFLTKTLPHILKK